MIVKEMIRHYIGGQDLGEPRNWQGLTIIKDFINQKEDAEINITDLDFVLRANKYLQSRILNGLDGGVGIFEGEPYKITVGDYQNPVYTFDGYLDFTDNATMIGGEELKCSLKKRAGTDWLESVADGFSFAYLADQNIITDSDYVKVPYVINYVPDGMQLIMLSMSLFMMTKELIEVTREIADLIGLTVNASTPVIGVGVGFGAVAVTAWDLGDWIYYALKIIMKIAYAVAIVIAIKNLIEQIFEQILPKKREHLGMRIRTMFEKSCQHLGLTFESSIEELEWVHIPRKDRKGGERGETGYPTNSGAIYTFGDCIRTFKQMFNADFQITNGVFRFERRDKFEVVSSYKIPTYFNDQERLLDRVYFNTDELVANYNINWQYDVQDQNSLDDQTGRVFQAITSPVNVIDQKLVSMKNLAEVSLPFSIGKTKTSLTGVEKLARDLGRFVDNLTGLFGSGTNFGSQIEGRLGSLLITSHFLTIGKMVKMSGNKLTKDQRGDLSANTLWEKYHYINSFAEINGEHNQYFRYKELEVPMSLKDFATLLENNKVTDLEGNIAYIERMEYQPHKGTALIDYRVKKQYTRNLKIEYV